MARGWSRGNGLVKHRAPVNRARTRPLRRAPRSRHAARRGVHAVEYEQQRGHIPCQVPPDAPDRVQCGCNACLACLHPQPADSPLACDATTGLLTSIGRCSQARAFVLLCQPTHHPSQHPPLLARQPHHKQCPLQGSSAHNRPQFQSLFYRWPEFTTLQGRRARRGSMQAVLPHQRCCCSSSMGLGGCTWVASKLAERAAGYIDGMML